GTLEAPCQAPPYNISLSLSPSGQNTPRPLLVSILSTISRTCRQPATVRPKNHDSSDTAMSHFQLSAQLAGHDADVRAVAFPSPDTVFSASRDRSVRRWQRTPAGPFDSHVAAEGTDYINSITFVPPSAEYPEGL